MTEESLLEWAGKVLENEASDEMMEIKKQILRRVAVESDIKQSRIPAPLNITEIGGYFNLIMKLRQDESLRQEKVLAQMLTQTLSAILGLPMKTQIDEA